MTFSTECSKRWWPISWVMLVLASAGHVVIAAIAVKSGRRRPFRSGSRWATARFADTSAVGGVRFLAQRVGKPRGDLLPYKRGRI